MTSQLDYVSPYDEHAAAAATWDSMLRRQLQERLGRDIHDSPQHTRTRRDRSANTISNTVQIAIPTASSPVAQHDLGGELSSNIGVTYFDAFTGAYRVASPPPEFRPRLARPPPASPPPEFRGARRLASPPPARPPPSDYPFPPGYPPPLDYPPPPAYAYDLPTGILRQGFRLIPVNLIPVTLGPVPISAINVSTDRSRDLGQEVTQSEQSDVTAIDQLTCFANAQSQEGEPEKVQGIDDKTEEMLSTYLEKMKIRRDELKSTITRPPWALMPVEEVHHTRFLNDEESQQLGASLEDFFNSPASQKTSKRSTIPIATTPATPRVTWAEDFQELLREADVEPTDDAEIGDRLLQPSTPLRLQPLEPLGDRPLPLLVTPSTSTTANRLRVLTNQFLCDSKTTLLSPIQEEHYNINSISPTGSTTEEATSDTYVTDESINEGEIASKVAIDEAAIERAIGAIPPTEFPRFNELKKHIRKRIWHFALPRARMIKLTKTPNAADIYSTAPVPAILQVNREARALALRYYRLAFAPEGGIAKTYFDFSRDYLYTRCSGCFGSNCKHKQVLTDDHANVKYCAWEGPMSFNPFRKIFKYFPNLRGLVLLRGVSTVSRPGLICTADKCHPVAKHLWWFVDDIGWDGTPFEWAPPDAKPGTSALTHFARDTMLKSNPQTMEAQCLNFVMRCTLTGTVDDGVRSTNGRTLWFVCS